MSQSAIKDYSSKASELIGTAKKTAVEKGVVSEETAQKPPGGPAATEQVKKEDFPTAPKTEIPSAAEAVGSATEEKAKAEEPLLA